MGPTVVLTLPEMIDGVQRSLEMIDEAQACLEMIELVGLLLALEWLVSSHCMNIVDLFFV